MRSPGLRPINGIERLVEEQSNGPRSVYPSWHVLVERWVVP